MPLRQFSGRSSVAQMPRRGARSPVTRDAEGSNRPQTPECRECRGRAYWVGRSGEEAAKMPGPGATGSPRWETNAQLSHPPRSICRRAGWTRLSRQRPLLQRRSKVERFARVVGARLSRCDPEVDTIQRSIRQRRCSTVLDGEIDRFLSAASPTTSRGRRNQDGIAISRPIRLSAYAPFIRSPTIGCSTGVRTPITG